MTDDEFSIEDLRDALTVEQFADDVAHVTRWYARKLCREGQVRAVWNGRRWLIPRSEAARWLRGHTGKPDQ